MPQRPLDENDPTLFLGVRLPSKLVTRLRSEAKRSGDTLSAHVRRLLEGKPEAFNPSVSAEAAARLAQLEQRHKQVLAERDRLKRDLNGKAVFTPKQYAALLKCVHPDTVHSASEGMRASTTQLVVENKERLVKAEEPAHVTRSPAAGGVPKTAAEMRARKAQKAASQTRKAAAQ